METQGTSAAKLLALLEALSDGDSDTRDGLTVAALARQVGREKSVVSRQLRPLVELGLVERDDDGRHRVGWRLFAVAAKAGDQRLLLLAPPVMRRLSQLVHERVHLSIRQGTDVFTIVAESPHRTVEAVGWVGRTVPVISTASGRALLFDHSNADLHDLFPGGVGEVSGPTAPKTVQQLIEVMETARQRGFAAVVDEFDADLTAVGAPVRDVQGRVVAALNVSGPTYRLRDQVMTAGRHVSRAAQHLSRALSSPLDPHP